MSGGDLQIELFDDIKKQLQSKLDFILVSTEEIKAGTNNRLFKLVGNNGRKLLAKVYARDDRNRLEREFHAINFMREHKIESVPQAFFKNDKLGYAIYSFVEGKTKKIEELSKNEIDQFLEFIIKLHKLSVQTNHSEFPMAALASLTLKGYVNNIQSRLKDFQDCLTSKETSRLVVEFSEKTDIGDVIDKLVNKVIGDLSTDEINKTLDAKGQRLCPTDFGPHNALFAADSKVTFVDFEYFGWDDPARLIADFLVHDQTVNLADNLKKYFVDTYKTEMGYSEAESHRLEVVTSLCAIEWLTIFLQSVTPKKLEKRHFADINFDEDKYVKGQLAKFEWRLTNFN